MGSGEHDKLLSSGILQGLRDVGDSIVLMGKNTMMKRSIRLYCEKTGDDKWPALLDHLVGNVGLIFTKADLAEVCAVCLSFPACRVQRQVLFDD